ncbi:zinc finger protein RFP-like isoform X2 [Pleurodeles waltl]|uniref:zinc finger protein RFP-like isoform X2 n=1 Tax=Pleurodeles waltl TaxID=8319 RepID=UPI0037098C63
MAAADPTNIIHGEATCPICLGFFTDPVVTGCGHNFCRVCITSYWEGYANNFSCPQCRRTLFWKDIKPNRLLASVVEAAKLMKSEAVTPPAGDLCEVHNEELKLYCHDDETAICVVCDRSREHRYHSVIPIEEAAQDYKEIFQRNLEPLRNKSEDLAQRIRQEEEIVGDLRTEIEAERAHIKGEIEKLHQHLNDEEHILLYTLEEAETYIHIYDKKIITKFSQDLRNLKTLIDEIAEKCQQPAKEFIKDAKDILSRIHKELSQEFDSAISVAKDLPQEPMCAVRIQEKLLEEPDGIKEVIYDYPNTERKLPEKKSRFLNMIQKKLFPMRKKDKPSRAQDTENFQLRSAKVLYDYEADDEDELSIYEGDIITQITVLDEGWWYGMCNETFGMFPANYVELL